MKYVTILICIVGLCGCVQVTTPHKKGDKLILNCDVYLVKHKGSLLSSIDINNERNITLPSEVATENIGKTNFDSQITGILPKGTALEVIQFDLDWAVGYTYSDIVLRNVQTKEMYDLSNSNTSLLRTRSTSKNSGEMFLSPLVFQPYSNTIK